MTRLYHAAAFPMRVFAAALLAALLAAPLLAQQDGPPSGPPPDGMDQGGGQQHGPSVDRELKRLTKLLTLTTDQQTQVKTILTDRNQKIGELMRSMGPAPRRSDQQQTSSDTTTSTTSSASSQQSSSETDSRPSSEQMEQIRTQMKAIRNEANSKISALLSSEQAAKFQSWLKQQRQRGEEDGMPPPPPDGGMGGPPSGGGGPGGSF